jgi:hypothetical protein
MAGAKPTGQLQPPLPTLGPELLDEFLADILLDELLVGMERSILGKLAMLMDGAVRNYEGSAGDRGAFESQPPPGAFEERPDYISLYAQHAKNMEEGRKLAQKARLGAWKACLEAIWQAERDGKRAESHAARQRRWREECQAAEESHNADDLETGREEDEWEKFDRLNLESTPKDYRLSSPRTKDLSPVGIDPRRSPSARLTTEQVEARQRHRDDEVIEDAFEPVDGGLFRLGISFGREDRPAVRDDREDSTGRIPIPNRRDEGGWSAREAQRWLRENLDGTAARLDDGLRSLGLTLAECQRRAFRKSGGQLSRDQLAIRSKLRDVVVCMVEEGYSKKLIAQALKTTRPTLDRLMSMGAAATGPSTPPDPYTADYDRRVGDGSP